MDSASSPPVVNQDDEWDTDGFVIPTFRIDVPENSKTPPLSPKASKKEEGIDLGLLGVPSQQTLIEPNPAGRKQKLKHKLKEADKRSGGTGRENKIENLRELVGVGTQNGTNNMPKSSPRDWLDPHCHESEFERRPSQ